MLLRIYNTQARLNSKDDLFQNVSSVRAGRPWAREPPFTVWQWWEGSETNCLGSNSDVNSC